jgi:uncharacterized membrane protein YccC
MPDQIIESVSRVWALIGGGVGAAVGVAVSPPMSRRLAWVSIASGVVMGGSAAPLIGWYFDVPSDLLGYIGCLIGMPGAALVWAIISIAKDPIATLNRIRGVK